MSDKNESTPVSDEKPHGESKTVYRTRYRVVVPLSYGDKHVAKDEIVDDIPTESLGWLLEGHYIETVK